MPVRAVTFDVYSAMYDTRTSLAQAVEAFLRRKGLTGDPVEIARSWRQKQREFLLIANSLDREPASNRRAIDASLRYALRHLVPTLTDAEVHELTAAWEDLPPWPEVVDVLRELRRRPLVLATLSNGDAAMLRALLARLPVPFDHILSSEGGRFKPHPSVYRKALETLGVSPAEWLHVAGSATDAMGATASGIRTLWVNRFDEVVDDPRFSPAHQAVDLRGVLNVLDAAPS